MTKGGISRIALTPTNRTSDDDSNRRRNPRVLGPGGEDERHLRLDAAAAARHHEPHARHGRAHRRRLEGLARLLRRRHLHLHLRLAVLIDGDECRVPGSVPFPFDPLAHDSLMLRSLMLYMSYSAARRHNTNITTHPHTYTYVHVIPEYI